jgi:hypothetical protein
MYEYGLFLDGLLVSVYPRYDEALEALTFAYEETGIPHELKIIFNRVLDKYDSRFNIECEKSTVVRFKDGKYLGLFGKAERLIDAIKFDGDWQREIHLKNNPIRLSEEDYEVKTVEMWIRENED